MNIVVLNGSPKGDVSVTMQYVRYLQEVFPQHQMTIHNIAQQLPKLERDPDAFGAIVEAVRAADGVLWAFPLYYFAVHGNYKRFIELIWERGAQEAFRGKYAASLSTSIHFYDHAAHAYIEAICDDLEMRYVSAFPAAMQDLLRPEGRAQLQAFGRDFFAAIEAGLPTQRSYAPLRPRAFAYVPGPAASQAPRNGRRILIVTDAQPAQANLIGMVERFAAAWDGPVEVINLHQVDIKGGCLGCIRCGPDNECAYAGKDGFIDFYNDKVRAADILVFAGAIKDRYLSSRWKTFFDRSFFKTHTPTLIGKQIAFIISGPLSQIAPLREVLQAWVEIERANLVGFITDEEGDAAEIDGRLDGLARLPMSARRASWGWGA